MPLLMKDNDGKCSGFNPGNLLESLKKLWTVLLSPPPSVITAESFQGELGIRIYQKFSKVSHCDKFQVKEIAEMFPESYLWISTT